jgi:hypothetical protein
MKWNIPGRFRSLLFWRRKRTAPAPMPLVAYKRRGRPPNGAAISAQACLVCQRSPCDAHHLKFAQPRALGHKVSDEYTVPLCRDHHQDLHRQGNEIAWWTNLQIKPIEVARDLWAIGVSNNLGCSSAPAIESRAWIGSACRPSQWRWSAIKRGGRPQIGGTIRRRRSRCKHPHRPQSMAQTPSCRSLRDNVDHPR